MSVEKQTTLQTALKEWSVAVDALSRGETAVLLRKGGIKEHNGRFIAQAERAVLFPTFEHQKPELLKPHYQSLVTPVSAGWHPPTIELKAWAEISHIFLTTDEHKVSALADFHIWQPQLAQERLKWKPQQPLYVMALRVYRLPEPVIIPWTESYKGCRSWVDLDEALVIERALPAIAEMEYKAEVAKIEALLS
ncbi:MAG: DUF1802 family protein [Phormidesmis sp.]